MKIPRLVLLVALLKVLSCTDAFPDESTMVVMKEEIRRAVEMDAVEAFPQGHARSLHHALISLANEGFVSIVGSFLTKLCGLSIMNSVLIRFEVILRTSIEDTAKLLQLSCFSNSGIRYEVVRRDDAGDLMAYLRANTTILDGDRLRLWLREASLRKAITAARLTHLAVHANYDTLKAARDELLLDNRYKELSLDDMRVSSNLLLSAMTRVIKRQQSLLTLFVTEGDILPQAVVEVMNGYITADL